MSLPQIKTIKGAQIALYPIDSLKAVSLCFKIRAGSWFEDNGHWGKAHLLEHMLFHSTEKFQNHEAMDIFKEENGIYANAFTGGSQISLELRLPGESLEAGLELASQMLFHLTINPDTLKKEKDIVEQEYTDKWSKPNARYGKKIDEHLFGQNHPYIRDGVGEIDYVRSLTAEDLLAFQKRFFVPANISIGIAGNFSDNQVISLLKKLLPEPGKFAPYQFPPITPKWESFVHQESDMNSALIDLFWPTKGDDQTTIETRFLHSFASYLLGGSERSSLFKRIRQELGLAYKIGSSFGSLPTAGTFSIYTSTKPENTEKVVTEIKKAITEFIEKPVDPDLFKRSKNYLNMQKQMVYESTLGTATNLANCLFWDQKVISPEEYADILNSFSEKDVRELLQKVTASDPLISIMKS